MVVKSAVLLQTIPPSFATQNPPPFAQRRLRFVQTCTVLLAWHQPKRSPCAVVRFTNHWGIPR